MAKKNFTFSLDQNMVEKAKKTLEQDELRTFNSFNHFVEVAIATLYQQFKEQLNSKSKKS
jgi:hypothetical protein